MTGPLRAGGALARGALTLAVVVSLVVLFAPGSDVPGAPPGVDKVVHFSLFAVLAATGRWAGARRSLLAGALVLYGALSELLQGIPALHRDPAVGDWLADVLGTLAGLLLTDMSARRRSR